MAPVFSSTSTFCRTALGATAAAFILMAPPAIAADDTKAPDNKVEIPAELNTFVEPGTHPISVDSADLNGDGLQDYILVLEKPAAPDGDLTENQRPLLIIIREPGGALKVAKRNDKIVYCSTCGGMMGDPFQPLDVGPKKFTVNAYGGSGWRWNVSYEFGYSRKDNSWQLVHVTQGSFHAADPDKGTSEDFKPPKDFGKIDIADFDPENWKGKGPK